MTYEEAMTRKMEDLGEVRNRVAEATATLLLMGGHGFEMVYEEDRLAGVNLVCDATLTLDLLEGYLEGVEQLIHVCDRLAAEGAMTGERTPEGRICGYRINPAWLSLVLAAPPVQVPRPLEWWEHDEALEEVAA